MTLATVVASIIVLVAAPAHASGSWSSYMQGVRVGFDSRVWNHNGESSAFIQLSTCRTDPSVSPSGNTNTNLLLRRTRTWPLPHASHGDQQFFCYTSSTRYWYNLPATAGYYFRVHTINGSSSIEKTLNVNTVYVSYW